MKNKIAKVVSQFSSHKVSLLKLNVQADDLPVAFLESISDGFVAVNENWQYIYVNQKAALFFNSTPATLVGTSIWDIYFTEKAFAFRNACERVMKNKQPEVLVFYCEILNRYIEHRIHPISKGISIFYKDNTEKEKALIALEQSEKKWKALVEKENENSLRLQTILNNHPECVKLVSPAGMLLDINTAGLEMLEAQSLAEVQNKEVTSFLHPEDVQIVQTAHRKVCDGRKEKIQFRVKNKSGRIIWMDSSLVPLKNEAGDIYAVLSVTRDITAAREAENSLLNSRQQLQRALSEMQKIMDSSLDVICTFDENGVFMQVSAACQKAWGYKPEEMIGRRGMDFVLKEEWSHTIASNDEIRNTLQESIFETSLVAKNGRVIPIVCSAKWDPKEKIMYAIARDNTERKQTEEALRVSKERYHQLFYTNPLPLWLFDIENLQFLEVNEAALKKYEYSRKQFLQLTMKDIMTAKEAALFNHEIVESSFNGGDDFSVSARHVKKSGDIIFVDMKWHRMMLNGRRMVMCLVVDVTEKVNLENRLLQEKVNRQIEITKATIQAQEAERNEIGRELHDNVNQILTTARLYIDQAQTDMNNRESFLGAGKNFVMKAIEEIRRLSRSLVAHTVADLGIADSLTDLIETIMMVQKIKIVLHHEGFDESLIDENMKLTIYRIVQEQLNNILKHANATKVAILLRQDAGVLSLSVSDNGVGFDTSAKRKGVGITNIINRAELYNGIVTLDSSPGAGCLLTVVFPS